MSVAAAAVLRVAALQVRVAVLDGHVLRRVIVVHGRAVRGSAGVGARRVGVLLRRVVLVGLGVVIRVLVVRVVHALRVCAAGGEVVLGDTGDKVRVVQLGGVSLSLPVGSRVRCGALQRLLEELVIGNTVRAEADGPHLVIELVPRLKLPLPEERPAQSDESQHAGDDGNGNGSALGQAAGRGFGVVLVGGRGGHSRRRRPDG